MLYLILVLAIIAIGLFRLTRGGQSVARFYIEGKTFSYQTDPVEVTIGMGGALYPLFYTSGQASEHYTFAGEIRFPQRIFQGDSHSIVLELFKKPAEEIEAAPDSVTVNDSKSGADLAITFQADRTDALEARIRSAAIQLSGDDAQTRTLSEKVLRYSWNARFADSGYHVIDFFFTVLGPEPDDRRDIGWLQRRVKVVYLFGMTKRNIIAISSILGVLSGVLTLFRIGSIR